VIPRLRGVVGARPQLPSRRALSRIRYTPITRAFRDVAELSWRLAQLQGFTAGDAGKSEGLLLDVAELWELFVLKCMSLAFPEFRVEHGTHRSVPGWLLTSAAEPTARLGRLKPDVLVFSGQAAPQFVYFNI